MNKENLLVLSFGANIGEREKNIERAYSLIEKNIGRMQKKSSFFETKPWGFESEDLFINSVACFSTKLDCKEVLRVIHLIEENLGRKRTDWAGYQSRTIDIDILFYNDLILESKDLTIPHPLLHKRDFVLLPLKEILPDFIHPVLKQRIGEIKLQ
ncbi:MAG: 2-amino-4-hydroxy-6-hydroxymethyldihydropteridine diphosphokinase [Bacteroidota bacterium]|nr:2-amino-4-hydroxy-6-hydroxymethyldihydropteridine diphosphokinase [Bacteroidota bacterium]